MHYSQPQFFVIYYEFDGVLDNLKFMYFLCRVSMKLTVIILQYLTILCESVGDRLSLWRSDTILSQHRCLKQGDGNNDTGTTKRHMPLPLHFLWDLTLSRIVKRFQTGAQNSKRVHKTRGDPKGCLDSNGKGKRGDQDNRLGGISHRHINFIS